MKSPPSHEHFSSVSVSEQDDLTLIDLSKVNAQKLSGPRGPIRFGGDVETVMSNRFASAEIVDPEVTPSQTK